MRNAALKPSPWAVEREAGRDTPPDLQPSGKGRPGLVLRVLAGLHRGGEISVTERQEIILGRSDECDVVLSDPEVALRHASVSFSGAHAKLRALQAGVVFCGKPLAPEEQIDLPKYVPFLLGRSAIAMGAPDHESWSEAEALLAHALDQPDTGADTFQGTGDHGSQAGKHDAAPVSNDRYAAKAVTGVGSETLHSSAGASADRDAVSGNRRASSHRQSVWVSSTVALLVVGLLLTQLLTQRDGAPAKVPEAGPLSTQSQRLAAILRDPAFAPLSVTPLENGTASLAGVLADSKSYDRLLEKLAAAGLNPVLQVIVPERMAQDVKEVFRVNGSSVQTRYQDTATVVVLGFSGAEKRAEEIVSHALSDVRGLKSVRFEPDPAKMAAAPAEPKPEPGPPAPTPEETAAKRIASVVDGSPSYILTADGARYFVGALLPQGYRIERISGSAVTITKQDGTTAEMQF